jgi:electron transport complex protein RnfG
VLAARVSRHRETPGLGDAIEVGKSDWIQQFAGAAADSWWRLRRTGGDFDRLTGATVTSRAVTAAIGAAARYYRDNRAQLHSRPASQAAADRP